MKTVLCLLFVCLFPGAAVFAQTEERTVETGVAEITLARDDGGGQAGEVVAGFITSDIPIHCLIKLNSNRQTIVKMNLVAVKANGLKPGTSVVTVNYKTGGSQTGVRFRASPDGGLWAAGKYRVDIALDGQAAGSLEFEIQKSASQTQPNNFTAPRKAKTKKTRRSQ